MNRTDPPLLLVGGAHVDRIARADAPFTAGASNPGRARETIGGGAFNAAMALRAFGAEIGFLGVRGGDAAGARVAEALEAVGAADHSATWLDRATPSYTAVLDDAGGLVAAVADMALYGLAGVRLLRRRHVREHLARSRAILVDANFPETVHAALARLPAEKPIAAIGVSPAKVVRLRPLLHRLSVLFVSRGEAAALTGLAPSSFVEDLAKALGGARLEAAVVTDGAAPAAILDRGEVVLQAPSPVEQIRDVTGAGDTLAAIAFLAALEGAPLPAAVRLGMAAASRRIAGELRPGCRAGCEAEAERLAPPIPR